MPIKVVAGYTFVGLNTVNASPSNSTSGLIESSAVRTESTAIPSGITHTWTDFTSGPSVTPTCMPNVVNSGPTSSNNGVDEPIPERVPTCEGHVDYARALIDIRVDQELKEDMVIVIPIVEDDGEVLQTARVKYEWETPRCSVCRVFGHDDMLCPKQPVEKLKKQHTNHYGFQHPSSSQGMNVGSNFQVKPKKPIWQVFSKNNSASSSGTKKNFEVSRKVMSSTKPFDALNTIEEGDELRSNGGRQIQVDHLVNEDNDSEVEEVYDETGTYMASTSFNANKTSKSGSR
nr:hypothetical protein [Tanacetum cinerariifolium]